MFWVFGRDDHQCNSRTALATRILLPLFTSSFVNCLSSWYSPRGTLAAATLGVVMYAEVDGGGVASLGLVEDLVDVYLDAADDQNHPLRPC